MFELFSGFPRISQPTYLVTTFAMPAIYEYCSLAPVVASFGFAALLHVFFARLLNSNRRQRSPLEPLCLALTALLAAPMTTARPCQVLET